MTGRCCRGQTICKSCLDNWQKTSGANKCPVCSEEGSFNTHPNYPIEREINSLSIYCTNKEKGCQWQGELNDIHNHLRNSDGCQFEEVRCSNECGEMIQRYNLVSHVETECPCRKVNCQYCHDTGEHQFIEGQHKEECPKLPLPCPNNCEVGSIPREDMEGHRKDCPLEMIQCEYHNVGCEITIARKDKDQHDHEKMKEHLIKTKTTLSSALQRIHTMELLLYMTTSNPVARPTSNDMVLESSLRWSDKLHIMAMMSMPGDQKCPVILKMSDYNRQKTRKIVWYNNSFYTHNRGYKMCLRVDAAGNGKYDGTHLSVFLYLMKGPHDDELTWPLREKIEINLLNHISDSEHHSDVLSYDICTTSTVIDRVIKGEKASEGWGNPQFISNEDLHKITSTCQYLKDDHLFFQITKL